MRVGCNGCGEQWLPEDVGDSIEAVEIGHCSACGSSNVYYVYDYGTACQGCGKVDYRHPLGGCCSRPCYLLAGYLGALRLRDQDYGPDVKRKDVAQLYSLALRVPDQVDWPAVNARIVDRWSLSGLQWIKAQAWKQGE